MDGILIAFRFYRGAVRRPASRLAKLSRRVPNRYHFIRTHIAPPALESPMRTARYHILTAHRRKILQMENS